MRMQTKHTARKVKASSLAAGAGAVVSYTGIKLAMPDLPEEVAVAGVSLLTALLSWLTGYRIRPALQDKIVAD